MHLAVRAFLLIFGLLFVGLGAFIGVKLANEARAGANRAEQLVPASAAVVATSALGTTLLVEGTLSKRNPARFHAFVAYIREEFRGADEHGDDQWVEDERGTPPLLIETSGLVQVSNEDYALVGTHEQWQEEGLNWNSQTEEGTKRYTGMIAGRPVLALGVVAPSREGNTVRAEWLFGGTRQRYIASQRETASFLPWIGLAFAFVGAAVAYLGVWRLRHWR